MSTTGYLSLKGVELAFKKWKESDPNLKGYGFGQIFNQNGQPKQEQVYPQMWVSPGQQQPIIGNQGMLTINRTFQILFFDIKLADGSNENQVISDCEEFAMRFIRWIMNANDEIDVVQSPIITPFTDKFLDDVAGVMVDFVIQFNGNNDECDDPNGTTNINFI